MLYAMLFLFLYEFLLLYVFSIIFAGNNIYEMWHSICVHGSYLLYQTVFSCYYCVFFFYNICEVLLLLSCQFQICYVLLYNVYYIIIIKIVEITLETFQYISRIIYYMYYNKQLILLYRRPEEYNSNSITAKRSYETVTARYSSKRQFENLQTIYI
jgi:hypothetical protein